jgi:hypothetical protein
MSEPNQPGEWSRRARKTFRTISIGSVVIVLLASTWAFVASAAAPEGNSPAQTPVRDIPAC